MTKGLGIARSAWSRSTRRGVRVLALLNALLSSPPFVKHPYLWPTAPPLQSHDGVSPGGGDPIILQQRRARPTRDVCARGPACPWAHSGVPIPDGLPMVPGSAGLHVCATCDILSKHVDGAARAQEPPSGRRRAGIREEPSARRRSRSRSQSPREAPEVTVARGVPRKNGDATWQATVHVPRWTGRELAVRAPSRVTAAEARDDGHALRDAFVEGGYDACRELQTQLRRARE